MLTDPTYIRLQLAFLLQVIIASERLLAEAAQECDGDLQAYYLDHLREETDHAKWLAEDLDGFSTPIDAIATAMVGSQYYLIKHIHPVCLLGYMLALENPMPMKELEALEAVHGKSLLRTVRIHAEADVGHREELLRQIKMQTPQLQHLIEQNHAQTLRYLTTHQSALAELNQHEEK